jgi:glycosyltransferase involved in cell wall biosynthesis
LRSFKWVRDHAKSTIRAFIVGDGESRGHLEQLCRELELSYSSDSEMKVDVYFTSWVKNVDYVNAGADIIALTSKNEGTPVSLIEAQAGNRPIISTRVGGIENVVIPNETALLSEPEDEERFRENLLRMTDDAAMREAFGRKGWAFVKDKFTYERLVADVAKLYDSLLP